MSKEIKPATLPLPLHLSEHKFNPYVRIKASDGSFLGTDEEYFWWEDDLPRYIVHACNEYPNLKEQNEMLITALENILQCVEIYKQDEMHCRLEYTFTVAKAALAIRREQS